MSYPATWMNIKHIPQNERGLTEKIKYIFIAVFDALEMINYSNGRKTLGCPEFEGGRRVLNMGTKEVFVVVRAVKQFCIIVNGKYMHVCSRFFFFLKFLPFI